MVGFFLAGGGALITGAGGHYTVVNTPNGTEGFSFGDTTDASMYSSNDTAVFRARAGTPTFATINSSGLTLGVVTERLIVKRGSNGAVGTFACTSGGTITINNTYVAITDTIIISLNTVGGTISTNPTVNAVTAATSFTAKCATSDTSTYNYAIFKNAA